jgi:hypothetical protein
MEKGIAQFEKLKIVAERGLNDELLFGLVGYDCEVEFFPIKNPYQEQGLGFRWDDDSTFLHLAPMRYTELIKTVNSIVKNRRQFGAPSKFALIWANGILKRRQEILGRNRRLSNMCEKMTHSVVRQSNVSARS